EPGIVAGVDLAQWILQHVNPETEVNISIPDGAMVEPGDVIFTAYGRVQALLVAERTMLNFMQRMSGIATRTNKYVQLVRHTKARILDTRKTSPGLRQFEKWAVRLGGGHNHRFGLYDMIMIKDNHIDFCGGIEPAVKRVQAYMEQNDLDLPIEVETRNLEEVKQALFAGGVHRIMLDNFELEAMREAVQFIRGRVEVEASGGVNLETVKAIAETGVDYISVGELTHTIDSLDLSFKAII
ncbi:MAG TPA: carboxylating nicotinate-nucleotide diphosphorylase, partial [Chitinophagales bacterium]|nr:carboxylating nicotinate-nucleotide diphosphorylase [Chitinophagales bacterium]